MTLLRKQSLYLALSVLLTIPAAAHDVDFSGESVTIQIGFPPGGGYDTYARVLARHYGRFLLGNPTVVPKNMPGAGSLRAANHIYNLTAKDSTEIATFSASTAMEPMMGNPQAKFVTAKFQAGSAASTRTSLSAALAGNRIFPPRSLTCSRKAPRSSCSDRRGRPPSPINNALILRNVLGANIRVAGGYQGQREVNLAMQRGEVHGVCGLLTSAIKAQSMADVQAGQLKLFLQMGPKVTSEFGASPRCLRVRQDRRRQKRVGVAFQANNPRAPVRGIAKPAQESAGRAAASHSSQR